MPIPQQAFPHPKPKPAAMLMYYGGDAVEAVLIFSFAGHGTLPCGPGPVFRRSKVEANKKTAELVGCLFLFCASN